MKRNNRVQEYFSVKFRRLLSQDPQGIPPWMQIIADGETGGLFLPTDAPWVIHRDFGTLVGGIRALLLQALHPATLAGVRQHSRYEEDPLGRLAGTIRWLTTTTFGSFAAIEKEASRVNRLHQRVVGEKPVPYRAADPHLLLWVHIAFTQSFLVAHQSYADSEIPGGADAYVSQWARSVEPLGLADAPKSVAELNRLIAKFNSELALTDDTRAVVKFIKNPPLPKSAMPIYHLLFAAAVVSLDSEHQKMLGLKTQPKWLVTALTRSILRFIRFAIGPENQIEEGALNRLRRLGLLAVE
jgi:uncharacterized protein (DUF2236 family)